MKKFSTSSMSFWVINTAKDWVHCKSQGCIFVLRSFTDYGNQIFNSVGSFLGFFTCMGKFANVCLTGDGNFHEFSRMCLNLLELKMIQNVFDCK